MAERLRITAAGKVGINSTAPADLLTIGAGANALAFGAKDTSRNNHVWQMLNNDNEGNAEFRMFKNSVSGTHAQSINFATSGDNNYILDGNFGLGTNTPVGNLDIRNTKANLIVAKTGLAVEANSDLHTSYDLIQLGAGGALASYSTATATADTQFIHNAYRHSGGNWKHRYADTAMRFRMNSPANTFIFENAASGSADGDITFTERLRITSTGQLQATSAADVRFTLGSSCAAGTNDSVHIRADSADLKFMAASSGNTIFEVNGTETLRVTSTGDINVHNTTAAATTDPITVDLGGQYTADASITNQNLKLKLYSNGSNNDTMGITAGASGVSYVSSIYTGHIFYTVPAAVDTLVERLRITSGGQVGINTTTIV